MITRQDATIKVSYITVEIQERQQLVKDELERDLARWIKMELPNYIENEIGPSVARAIRNGKSAVYFGLIPIAYAAKDALLTKMKALGYNHATIRGLDMTGGNVTGYDATLILNW